MNWEYFQIFGIIWATFSWSCPSNWLCEISNELIRVLGPRRSSWPFKELFLRSRNSNLVLFSSSQLGKLPVKLLWERSTTINLNWYWRKPGRSPVRFQLKQGNPTNWIFSFYLKFVVIPSNYLKFVVITSKYDHLKLGVISKRAEREWTLKLIVTEINVLQGCEIR